MATSDISPSRSSKRVLSSPAVIVLCMLVTIMEGYNLIVYGAVVPLLLQDTALKLNEGAVGFIGGIVYLGALIGVLLCTPLAERYGRQKILVAAAATFAIGALLSASSESALMLGTSRLITGIGVGGAITTALTLARNHAPHRRVSLVVTIAMAGVPLGGTLASILGIFVMPVYGWRVMFIVGSVLTAIILVALVAARIEEPAEVSSSTLTGGQKLKALLANGGYRIVILIALAAVTNMITWLGLNVWLAQAMAGLGFDLQIALFFIFTLTGAAVLGSFITATAADRFGSSKVTVVCTIATLAGLLVMLFGPSTLAFAVIAVVLMGIGGHSAQNLIVATASSVVSPHSRGTIFGVLTSMAFIGSFLGPALGGIAFAQNGPAGVFGLYSISAVLCLGLCTGLFLLHRGFDDAAVAGKTVQAVGTQ